MLDIKGNVKAVPASVLAAAAKFLNDSGVDRPERVVDQYDTLNDELPDLDHLDKHNELVAAGC